MLYGFVGAEVASPGRKENQRPVSACPQHPTSRTGDGDSRLMKLISVLLEAWGQFHGVRDGDRHLRTAWDREAFREDRQESLGTVAISVQTRVHVALEFPSEFSLTLCDRSFPTRYYFFPHFFRL